MKSKDLINLYFVVLVVELVGEVLFDLKGIAFLVWAVKPLLMPILAYWYYTSSQKGKFIFDKLILAAFGFSWLGDIFLMPNFIDPSIGFLLGLGSFLLAHIMYLVAFLKTNIKASSIYKSRPHLALPFVLFGLSLVLYLKRAAHPDFVPMEIPVMVYASVIMLMVLAGIGRYNKVQQKSFSWVVIGALLFMFSDTLIALSRFSDIFEQQQFLARLLIMPLYVVGQYLIGKGALLQHHSTDDEN